ncbi:FkbM family methyltransferase [Roseicyclus amphidinii]|uniref:FkbM family methyltransferase n=1 Tax=Roseicyclus amphidinii TaxID=3034232 RepID=UPI0024E0AD8C|nr:FkbM family methyltransferase [Roseicyclus sp. Amp-Y-6]
MSESPRDIFGDWRKSVSGNIAYSLMRHLRDTALSMRGVAVNAQKYRLPLGVVFKIDEIWMSEVIEKILPHTKGIFLDIGVNLGQTLLSLRSVDKRRSYLGFEPNVDCVSVVRKIIRLNEISHCVIIPAACSGQFGIARLFHYLDSDFDSSASMLPNFRDVRARRGETTIAVASVHESLTAMGVERVGIVKIDVEGFEADVLEALEMVLARDRPFVIIEVLPVMESTSRMHATTRISALLARLGYISFEIVKDEHGNLRDFREVACMGAQKEVQSSDFLLSPVSTLPITSSK